MKKIIRVALAVLALTVSLSSANLLGGDPKPTCDPFNPTCPHYAPQK